MRGRRELWVLAVGGLIAVGMVQGWAAGEGQETAARPVTAGSQRRPNVLFLFTDDQRPDGLGALGNPQIHSPNMDALVERGFVMRNAYCLGANIPAVCTPSRNMLLSGRAFFRWRGNLAEADDTTFPRAMKAAGYETYHHGKKGNTATRIQATFDHNKYLADDEKERRTGEPGKVIVDEAIEFLKSRQGEAPFFMYLAFGNPHDPRVAAPAYQGLYDRKKIALPRNYLPVHPFDNGEMTVRDERLAPWPRGEEEIRRHVHEYYAVISAMDAHIGRLLKTLEELGVDQETLIVFSSDHGLALGSHGLMGKQNLYEHSSKAPLVFAGAGIAPGKSEALVYLMDIYPTVCEWVGAKIPSGLDGQSFARVLTNPGGKARPRIFTAYREVQRAVRDERWKLIRYPQVNRTQLFDLRNDPDELNDLAGAGSSADRIQEMMGWIQEWQRAMGDSASLVVANPKPAEWTIPTENNSKTP